MISLNRALTAFLIAAAAALPAMGDLIKSDRMVKAIPVDVTGSFWLDNPTGPIDIVGVANTDKVSIIATRSVTAVDQEGLNDGWNQTNVVLEGNNATRYLKTVVPIIRSGKWKSSVSYIVHVPRSINVKIVSSTAEHINLSNITGNVSIRNFNGAIHLDAVTGSTSVDTVNSAIVVNYAFQPSADARFSSVNGNIEVHLPPNANFEWVADSIQGDFATTMPVRARFTGTQLHAGVNSPGGPTITTASLTGHSTILRQGTTRAQARLVSSNVRPIAIPRAKSGVATKYQQARYDGPLYMTIPSGSVIVGQVHGSARIETGVGAIELDTVWGKCDVFSTGGPMSLGDIFQEITAHTRAGDILVRAARDGGLITTDGGTIRLLYNGGPATLRSGGGDIMAMQAAAPIDAQTHSGDITITVDPNVRSEKLTAKTTRGNIVLNLSPHFGADIDATIVTSDPDSNAVHSDLQGLTITREPDGKRTRIRATGKINGGGERVELYAEEGNIDIALQSQAPITVVGAP